MIHYYATADTSHSKNGTQYLERTGESVPEYHNAGSSSVQTACKAGLKGMSLW